MLWTESQSYIDVFLTIYNLSKRKQSRDGLILIKIGQIIYRPEHMSSRFSGSFKL